MFCHQKIDGRPKKVSRSWDDVRSIPGKV